MNNFYITLPSNVSAHGLFPLNKIGNYITKLGQRLRLKGKWEVGLREISYTKSWLNVPQDVELKIGNDAGTELSLKLLAERSGDSYAARTPYNLPIDGVIRAGSYRIFELLHLINVNMRIVHKKLVRFPYFWYNKQTGKVVYETAFETNIVMNPAYGQYYPVLGDHLENLLGLRDEDNQSVLDKVKGIIKHGTSYINDYKHKKIIDDALGNNVVDAYERVDINAGINALFIYTNIVQESVVGDSLTRLLKVVHIPTFAEFGQTVNIRYDEPDYIPVGMNELETIEIDIKDDSGETIPFTFGRSVLTLHFRQYE
jgi:hypothetical protein